MQACSNASISRGRSTLPVVSLTKRSNDLWYLTSGPARVPIIFSNATLRLGFAPRHPQGGPSGVHFARAIDTVGTDPDPAGVALREMLAGFGIGARLDFLLLAFGVGVTCVSMLYQRRPGEIGTRRGQDAAIIRKQF
jgi:hypothetical protein